MSDIAVGIDLGTTYSCVAVYRNGRTEIIANAHGNRITPSVVSFGKERLIGDAAKNQEASNPENTVFGVKRLIGRRWEDVNVQQDIKHWPFKVENENGRPKVVVQHQGSSRSFFPEEISAMVLNCLKTSAETHLGRAVKSAVVTVPAYFNDSQRQATKDAATIAGLNVLRIINEPTAAALAYGLDQPLEEERNVLIFDLGGGTFDVSILCIEEGIFEVKSTAGDTHLGGEDLDNILTKYFAEEFKTKQGCDINDNKKAMLRLRKESERVKRMLSTANEVTVELDSLCDNKDFQTTITRAKFEDLCDSLLRKTLEPVKLALTDAQLDITDINEIVLVGGSTRIPKVQELLRDFFKGRALTQTVNPDEAVAAGAAVQASILIGDASETITDLVLLDVTPLSLGTTIREAIMDILIPRNTPIPVKITKPYTTLYDNQDYFPVEIREGERKLSKDNNLLGEFQITGFPKARAGVPKVQVTFEIDANGILHASAVMTSFGNLENKITIDKGRLSSKEIDRLIEEAKKFEQEDLLRQETAEAKNSLERFCRNLKARMSANPSISSTRASLQQSCDAALQWLQNHPEATKEEYTRKQREIQLLSDMTFMAV